MISTLNAKGIRILKDVFNIFLSRSSDYKLKYDAVYNINQ